MKFSTRTFSSSTDKHKSGVNALLFCKNKLFSASDDGQIKLWRKDLTLVKTVDAHSSSICSLVAGDDTIYSCSSDGTVKSWWLTNLHRKNTLLVSQNKILKLWFTDDILFASDSEGNINVFINEKLQLCINFVEPVKDMFVIGNLIYTIRDSGLAMTKVYSDGTLGATKTIKGRAPVCIAGDKICFATKSGRDILVHENSVDVDFKKVAHTVDAHEMNIGSLCGVQYDGYILLYSGGHDQVLNQWKITRNSIQKINACRLEMNINVMVGGPNGEPYIGGSDGQIVRVNL